MESILVSACLLGESVRYTGGDKRCDNPILQRWTREGRVVSVCPEVLGGLPVPRPPAEISNGAGGMEVQKGLARVMDVNGRDVSAEFLDGTAQVLQLTRSRRIQVAVLKEGSPSCGTGYTYDGNFNGTRVPLPGVCAACLLEAGVQVFNEKQWEQAEELRKQLEAGVLDETG